MMWDFILLCPYFCCLAVKCSIWHFMFAFRFLKLKEMFVLTKIVKFVLNAKNVQLLDCFGLSFVLFWVFFSLGGSVPCRNLWWVVMQLKLQHVNSAQPCSLMQRPVIANYADVLWFLLVTADARRVHPSHTSSQPSPWLWEYWCRDTSDLHLASKNQYRSPWQTTGNITWQ